MSEIKDIRTKYGVPKAIHTIIDGKDIEVKKIIEVRNGKSVVVWLIGSQTDMWQYVVTVSAGQEIRISVATDGLNDTFDWGDGATSIGYVNYHTYPKAGTYTITFSDTKKQNTYYAGHISPSETVIAVVQPSYSTKCYYSNIPNLKEITFVKPIRFKLVDMGYCDSLETFEIPVGVEAIEYLQYMTNLKTVKLPETLTTINDYAFQCDAKLTEIRLPDSLTTLGTDAFRECSNLENLVIGKGLTEISQYCFRDCNLKNIHIPHNIIDINKGAFFQNSNIATIEIEEGCKNIYKWAFQCSYNDRYKPTIAYLAISDSVQTIYDYAFANINSIKKVKIGTGIKYIGGSAFGNCNLSEMIINGYPEHITERSIGYIDGEKIAELTIYGKSGSLTETYATKNGFAFVEI